MTDYDLPVPALPSGHDTPSALVRAYVWGYPLVFAARLRHNMTAGPFPEAGSTSRSAAAPINTFGHQRLLSDAAYRVGVAPNVDTLYSVAWVDLAAGPVVLDTPDFGDRYFVVQVGFADSSSTAVGHRTHGGTLPKVILRARDSSRPPVDGLHIASPTRYAMFAARILVDPAEDGDLDRAHVLQDAMRLSRWNSGSEPSLPVTEQTLLDAGVDGLPDGAAFFRRLANVLVDWAPETVPQDIVADLRHAGFDDNLRLERSADAHLLQRAYAEGQALVAQGVQTAATEVNRWAVNYRGCDFGTDWLLRASVAHAAIYVNPAAEALYPVTSLDSEGRALTGSRRYEVRFPANGRPPVSYFWSLTMYHDQGFLVDNVIDRYAIGDRTRGLRFEDDGTLVIHISHAEPEFGPSNWLPAPAGGLRLMLRLYGPTADCLEGRWSPPPVLATPPSPAQTR